MSSSSPAPKVRKSITHRSLLIAEESPLPHPPSYYGSYSASYAEGDSGDYPADYPVRNLEIYLAYYSVSYRASYPERNSASYSKSCGESNWENSPSDCPENCPASCPESNLPSNEAGNPLSYSEINPADSPANCLGNSRPSAACRSTVRFSPPLPTPYSRLPVFLPRHHDLANRSHVPRPSSLAPDEIHPRRKHPHVVRARLQVQYLPPADVQ